MTKLAEIQSAILGLPATEREALRTWFDQLDEDPALLAAIDEADRSMVAEGGIMPEEIRQKLRTWASG
jgi:hypothetical protein